MEPLLQSAGRGHRKNDGTKSADATSCESVQKLLDAILLQNLIQGHLISQGSLGRTGRMNIYLSACLSVYLPISLFIHPSIYLSFQYCLSWKENGSIYDLNCIENSSDEDTNYLLSLRETLHGEEKYFVTFWVLKSSFEIYSYINFYTMNLPYPQKDPWRSVISKHLHWSSKSSLELFLR